MNSTLNFQTPLELFPLEIWEAIFESLAFKELTACYRATPTWNTALRDRSALFLFPEVFLVLAKRISINQILILRTVCKQWKETVDTFLSSTSRILQEEELASSACYWKPKKNDKISTIKKWLYKIYQFDSSQGIARFVQSVQSFDNINPSNVVETLNPFISRRVSCIDKCLIGHEIHRQRLRSHISTLLTNFGRFIWYFTLYFEYERNCNPVYCYGLAQAYLSHLKNVKILFIQSRGEYESSEETSDALNQQLEEAIIRKPIVTLEHLETLKIDGLLPRIVKEILVKNCHIKKLHLGDQSSLFTGDFLRNCIFNTELKEIKEFKGSTLWAKILTNNAIPEEVCWPLEKLSLSIQFNGDVERGDMRLATLFKLVSKFGQTLRHLDLTLWCLEGEGGSGLELELPHLQTLEIKADRFCFKSVDFLQNLGSIKKLDLSVKSSSEGKNSRDLNGVIEFNGYLDKMYESNIWSVVSSLEEVIIRENTIVLQAVVGSEEVAVTESEECFMYTREEYVSRVNAQILM